jgi:predicted ferric reductase
MAEHPFSISSSAQDSSAIEVTVKALGDFTARIGDVTPGELAYVDGPYGQFSIDRHRAQAYGFIVGGVGITPAMSMLRTMAERGDKRPVVLLYAASSLEEMTFREEIEAMADQGLNLVFVPIPTRPEPGWTGPTGFVTQELIERTFGPDRKGFEYFVCGPEPMMRAVSVALRAAGVHASQIRYELFGLV